MAKVKNESGQILNVPALGRTVLAGQVIEVDDDQVYGLTQQEGVWSPADKPAETAHKRGVKDHGERLAAEDRARHGVAEQPTETTEEVE